MSAPRPAVVAAPMTVKVEAAKEQVQIFETPVKHPKTDGSLRDTAGALCTQPESLPMIARQKGAEENASGTLWHQIGSARRLSIIAILTGAEVAPSRSFLSDSPRALFHVRLRLL